MTCGDTWRLMLVLLLHLVVSSGGIYSPDVSVEEPGEGTEPLPYVGEVRWIAFDYIPEGWSIAHGQSVNQASFRSLLSVIGDDYGPYGEYSTFVLPNLLDPALNHTSTMSEDEVQQLVSTNKDWVLLPIMAMTGMLPTAPLYPIIKSDRKFSILQQRLDRVDVEDLPPPEPSQHRVPQAEVDVRKRVAQAFAAEQVRQEGRGAYLREHPDMRPVDPKA